MAVNYLELADYLVIAEMVLEVPAEDLAKLERIGLADSAMAAPAAGVGEKDVYPDFDMKVAVLGHHLVKNHPLPDGNKRTAFLAMIEFVGRNGHVWSRAAGDPDETDRVIRALASSELSIEDFRDWVSARIA